MYCDQGQHIKLRLNDSIVFKTFFLSLFASIADFKNFIGLMMSSRFLSGASKAKVFSVGISTFTLPHRPVFLVSLQFVHSLDLFIITNR